MPPEEMPGVHLVMPMAGHGRRFSEAGFALPKPLLPLLGQPAFWWAAESVRRCFTVRSMTFVVLQEHVERFAIAAEVRARYPDAGFVVLPETTPGALVTAVAGCRDVADGWLVVNDCDHAFAAAGLARAVLRDPDRQSGFLCHFRARDPAYSYAEYDARGRLLRTVEKRVISDLAIAGAYGFRGRAEFLDAAARYVQDCPYDEPFMSGVYNTIVADGGQVRGGVLDHHVSFGTPAEYARAAAALAPLAHWNHAEALP